MRRIIFGVLALLLTSCATIVYEAPVGKELKMATRGDYAPTKIRKKVYYALWGLIPITSNSTAEMISGYCNEIVRAKSYYGIDDYLIGCFLNSLTITSMTVEIECK